MKNSRRFLNLRFGRLGSQQAANQHRRAIAHVGANALILQRRHAHVGARGIAGVCQVAPGIDQRAVQIENEQIHAVHAVAAFRRVRDSARTGLRRGFCVPNLYSTIFRCSVLRWIPSSLLAAERFPPVRSSAARSGSSPEVRLPLPEKSRCPPDAPPALRISLSSHPFPASGNPRMPFFRALPQIVFTCS